MENIDGKFKSIDEQSLKGKNEMANTEKELSDL